jgi:aspartyl-tRNA(Asn)/glutamyl-tRNA(Gln) amidotransferase subunit A
VTNLGPLGYLGIVEADAALACGQLTATDLIDAVLLTIDQVDPTINAYVCLTTESARAEAQESHMRAISHDRRGPLDGIPVAVKDIFDTAGVTTTYGAAAFADFVPSVDAHVVQRLRAAGAIIVGKTNTHELARGTTTDNAFFGATRNPWDITRHPGGSSGGSAAALAAGMTLGALGSDTGGSVRIPAHMAGVTGLKPTFGLIGRTGAHPLVRSYDHIGPMARSVADCALMLEAMVGPDLADPDSAGRFSGGYGQLLSGDVAGFRVRVIQDFVDEADPAVRVLFQEGVRVLQRLGIAVDSWLIPKALDVKGAQLASRAEGYLGIHSMFAGDFRSITEPVRDRLDVGAAATAADYLRGLEARARIEDSVSQALMSCEVLISPSYPYPAESVQPFDPRSNDVRNASLFNAARHPALSLPMGFVDGLPVGLQMVGRMFDDATLLQVGHAFQEVTMHHSKRPDAVAVTT